MSLGDTVVKMVALVLRIFLCSCWWVWACVFSNLEVLILDDVWIRQGQAGLWKVPPPKATIFCVFRLGTTTRRSKLIFLGTERASPDNWMMMALVLGAWSVLHKCALIGPRLKHLGGSSLIGYQVRKPSRVATWKELTTWWHCNRSCTCILFFSSLSHSPSWFLPSSHPGLGQFIGRVCPLHAILVFRKGSAWWQSSCGFLNYCSVMP